MKETKQTQYRKSPWRFVFLALAVAAGLWLVFWLILQGAVALAGAEGGSIAINEAASVGVIGGADGPTAIFVTGTRTGFDWDPVLMAVVLFIGIYGFLRLGRRKQK